MIVTLRSIFIFLFASAQFSSAKLNASLALARDTVSSVDIDIDWLPFIG